MHSAHAYAESGKRPALGSADGPDEGLASGISFTSGHFGTDLQAQLHAQEVRIQEVVVQESYAHYSQFLVNSEFEVRMRLDRQRDALHELEADAEAHKGRATIAEERFLHTEMDATRVLHSERYALH